MNAEQTKPLQMVAECAAVLDSFEATAYPIDGSDFLSVRDVDGDFMFRIHRAVNAADLHTMFDLHRRRFEAGMRVGRELAFADLRAFIGVPKAIEEAKARG